MVDEGKFDVWILNMRGTLESRRHLWLDADSDTEFWNYSFEEIATYDTTAAIDLI